MSIRGSHKLRPVSARPWLPPTTLGAQKNVAGLNFIGAKEIEKLAPDANITTGRALWSPNTAVIDPLSVIYMLRKKLESRGVQIINSARDWQLYQKINRPREN